MALLSFFHEHLDETASSFLLTHPVGSFIGHPGPLGIDMVSMTVLSINDEIIVANRSWPQRQCLVEVLADMARGVPDTACISPLSYRPCEEQFRQTSAAWGHGDRFAIHDWLFREEHRPIPTYAVGVSRFVHNAAVVVLRLSDSRSTHLRLQPETPDSVDGPYVYSLRNLLPELDPRIRASQMRFPTLATFLELLSIHYNMPFIPAPPIVVRTSRGRCLDVTHVTTLSQPTA